MTDIKTKIAELQAQKLEQEQIFLQLLQAGYKVEDINVALKSIASPEGEQPKKEVGSGRFLFNLVLFGILLIAAGIFSFVAANWQYLPPFIRLAGVTVVLAIAYYLGFHFKFKKSNKIFGEGFFLLGNLTFGAVIFLIAQIFNFPLSWPQGFLWWSIGILPVILSFQSNRQLTLFFMILIFGTMSAMPIMFANSAFGLLDLQIIGLMAGCFFMAFKYNQKRGNL